MISSQPLKKTISFINNNSYISQYFYEESIIYNIDCINSQNCLFLYKDYIIINCNKGIAIVLKKNKDLIQYIENEYNDLEQKELCIDEEENIHILYMKNGGFLFINILKEINGTFEITRKIEVIKPFDNTIKLMCLCKEDILIWENRLYIMKNNNNN